jgi:hypothetical protein
MTNPPDDTAVVPFDPSARPPICEECELPMEEITHGYGYEWACALDTCPKRFHPTFAELVDPELLIIMGQPDCYRCHQLREMTRVGNIVRFECANPGCNELVRLIGAKYAKVTKARLAAAALEAEAPTLSPSLPSLPSPPALVLVPTPTNSAPEPTDRRPRGYPSHLRAVPPLGDRPAT